METLLWGVAALCLLVVIGRAVYRGIKADRPGTTGTSTGGKPPLGPDERQP